MTNKEFEKIVDWLVEKGPSIMLGKSKDYTDGKDRLGNFKQIAGAFSALTQHPMTAKENVLQLLLLKIARLENLILKGIEPSNESLEDTMLDLFNYTILYIANVKEQISKNSVVEQPTLFKK